MKADPKPPGPRKLNAEWQAGIEEQKRQKIAKTTKGISPACVLPTAMPVPQVNLSCSSKSASIPAVKKEEPAPAVTIGSDGKSKLADKKEVSHGLGLTWESF